MVVGGLHEDLVVDNNGPTGRTLTLELRVAADFADLFEVKDGRAKQGRHHAEVGERRLTLSYRRGGFQRATTVTSDRPCEMQADRLRFELHLGPRERWRACIDVTCQVDGEQRPPGGAAVTWAGCSRTCR